MVESLCSQKDKQDNFKSEIKQHTHKYGIRVHHSVKEEIIIDQDNRDTLWKDAIKKEMVNI